MGQMRRSIWPKKRQNLWSWTFANATIARWYAISWQTINKIYIIFNKDKFITKIIACQGIIQRSSTISFLIPMAHLITFITQIVSSSQEQHPYLYYLSNMSSCTDHPGRYRPLSTCTRIDILEWFRLFNYLSNYC